MQPDLASMQNTSLFVSRWHQFYGAIYISELPDHTEASIHLKTTAFLVPFYTILLSLLFFPRTISLFSLESVIQALLALKAELRNCLLFHLTSASEWISPLPIRALGTSPSSFQYISMLAFQNCNKVPEMLSLQSRKVCFGHTVLKIPVHG